MSGTPNPSADVLFGDGNLQSVPDLGLQTVCIIGPATTGAFNKPRRTSDVSGVLAFGHGPLVGHASTHVYYGQPCYSMRVVRSIAGSKSTPVKTPKKNAQATLALSNTTGTVHATLSPTDNPGSSPVITGWIAPPVPMKIDFAFGSGTTAGNYTLSYVNEAGNVSTETLVAAGGAQTVTTTGYVARILSLTNSGFAIGGALAVTYTYDGPQDRYHAILKVLVGGQITNGLKPPQMQLSLDGGRTFGGSFEIPSDGAVDLTSYAGGFTPQLIGLTATFTQDSNNTTEVYGSLRTGSGNGDIEFTALKAGTSVQLKVSGNSTPLSIDAVVSNVVIINVATNGGGTATSTAAQVVSYLMTNAGANAIAARLCLSAAVVGTGATAVAALATSTFEKGSIVYKAKQPGVSLTITAAQGSSLPSITVDGSDVYISLNVDANSNPITTANAVIALIGSNAAAAALIYAIVDGTGDGTGIASPHAKIALVTDFDDGDSWSFYTSPPAMSNADLSAALLALGKREDILSNIQGVVVVKDNADATDFSNLHSALDTWRQKRQMKFGVISARYFGPDIYNSWTENEDTTKTAIIGDYPDRGTKVTIVAGECDTLIPAYGTSSRRNKSSLYGARLMNCPISELPSHVECNTVAGIVYSLPGVGTHIVPDSDPLIPTLASLWQQDDTLLDLHAQNMVTFRTIPRMSGIFVRQGLQYTVDGDDWIYITNRRIGDFAGELAYFCTVKKLNGNLLVDPRTGFLAESEHLTIENNINRFVGSILLNDNGIRHITALKAVSDRNINYAKTASVSVKLFIVPKFPLLTFTTTINIVATIDNQ